MVSKRVLIAVLAVTAVVCLAPISEATITPRAPNFQYFERPQYRYPYYDQNGRGRLLYGYGGNELYQYRVYSPLEGIH
ncbi:E3 ubiquitin-protein ligase RMA2 [Frankliniella fusca]|uniref:E3 ubiquitin-protein ligase RMA2 n=1 Tax=Frankliniella fusca TaxID=407009 RepID=A0AAE1LU02_9NEOP|nr:E3 ubiquitin-protein ligase RMA2 [Frankliniella fusca]